MELWEDVSRAGEFPRMFVLFHRSWILDFEFTIWKAVCDAEGRRVSARGEAEI